MIPLQIRITDHEATLTAAAVPYGVALLSEIDFAFIVDVDGDDVVMSPYEFACHSAVCAPPNKAGTGGKGGSEHKSGGTEGGPYTSGSVGGKAAKKPKKPLTPEQEAKKEAKKVADKEAKTQQDHDTASSANTGTTKGGAPHMSADKMEALFPGMRDTHKSVNPDGTFSIEGLDAKGERVGFSKEAEDKIKKQWDDLGPSEQDYVNNMVAAGKIALGIDLITNKTVDLKVQAQGLENSKWYFTAHDDAQKISDATGVPLDNVVAATTVLSAGRKWSGTKTGNAETAKGLAEIVKNPIDIHPTQAALDLMVWKREKSTKGPGQIGLHNTIPPLRKKLEAGKKVNSNDLDSASLVELMYAMNATRGHDSFAQWAKLTTNADGKVGAKSSPISAKVAPLYPFYTSKGTHQVKQAMAILRQEITPRQAISGPKFSSFYSNIRRPDLNYSTTNDVWQYRIQAGNLKLTTTLTDAEAAKHGSPTMTGTIRELTTGKGAVQSAQGLLQNGASHSDDHLESGDGMFRDSSVIMDKARKILIAEHPRVFGKMTRHEFQAAVWVHFGGGTTQKKSAEAWTAGLEQMRRAGLL